MHHFKFISVILLLCLMVWNTSAKKKCKVTNTITKTAHQTLTFCSNPTPAPHKRSYKAYKEVLICDNKVEKQNLKINHDCPKATVTCTPAITVRCTSIKSLTSRTTTTTTSSTTLSRITTTKTTTTIPKTTTTTTTSSSTSTSTSVSLTTTTSTTVSPTITSTSISTSSTTTTTSTSTTLVVPCCLDQSKNSGEVHSYGVADSMMPFQAASALDCCTSCFLNSTCLQWVFSIAGVCYLDINSQTCSASVSIPQSPSLGGDLRCSDGCLSRPN